MNSNNKNDWGSLVWELLKGIVKMCMWVVYFGLKGVALLLSAIDEMLKNVLSK